MSSPGEIGWREDPGVLVIHESPSVAATIATELAKREVRATALDDAGRLNDELRARSYHVVLWGPARGQIWCSRIRDFRRAGWRVPLVVLAVKAAPDLNTLYVASGADEVIDSAAPAAAISDSAFRILRMFQRVTSQRFLGGRLALYADRTVGWRESGRERRVRLPGQQFELLRILAESNEPVVPYGAIEQRLWNADMRADRDRLYRLKSRVQRSLSRLTLCLEITARWGRGIALVVREREARR